MSETVKDGGAAFPSGGGNGYEMARGMTLRDWFAGQALIGMGEWVPGVGNPWHDYAALAKTKAEWAYRQADAMLAAREGA